MPVVLRLLHTLRVQVAQVGWGFLLLAFLAHMLSSWALLTLARETALIAPDVWLYYYVTTATTIGYGDFSPQTTFGRLVAALWLMPGAIGLFAALIGKTTSLLVDFWRQGMQGRGDYSKLESHTVLMGWHGEATERMVDLLHGDSSSSTDQIVLCATEEMENPLPEKVRFVRGDSLASPSLLARAGVRSAERVLIYGNSDEQTLATAFAVLAQKPIGHVVVHFAAEESAQLLKTHYPQVECTQSLAVEMLVRASQDPGVSRLTTDLLSVLQGPTQYSMQLPQGTPPLPFGDLLARLKREHNAILLGFAKSAGGQLRLNPGFADAVNGGDVLYYMADQRIAPSEIDWQRLAAGVD
jgi:voltage-gated potassium channel